MKKNLLWFLFPFTAFAQWSNNSAINTAVCTDTTGDQNDARIVSDDSGGAIIVWVDARPTGNTDIYAQRLDSAGNAKWTANGVAICTAANDQLAPAIVGDGSSGATIVWKDLRNGNSDIYAQKINSSGIALWAANGVPVDTKTGEQIDPKIIKNDLDESIIVWQDSVSGNWDIYAQKLDFSGTKMWSAGGVAVCSAADDQINPRIEESGVIVWQDKRNGSDYNIYAQKLNSSGVPQWTANGVSVCLLAETQNNPKIKNDGNDEAIIAWIDKRNGSDYDIYAQHLNSSGVPQWTANGVVISAESGNQSAIDISTENISGAIITWKDYRNNIYADIYAQYINLSGTVQWATNGIAVSTKTFDQLNPNIVTDSSGAIIVWQDSSSGQWDVYGQKILLNGTTQWGTNGKIIANALNNQTSPKHIADGKNGAIIVFEDTRSGKLDIYAQNINGDGSLGTGIISDFEFSDFHIFPNPNGGRFQLTIGNLTNFKFQISIYNSMGELTFSKQLSTNNEQLTTNFLSGIYFYQISSEGKILHTGKMIVQ